VDLGAVKAATGPELAVCAIAAARNAQAVLYDAELLAGAGRTARAYSLSALAVEECGKAASLTALAMMPKRLRTQAPVGRMLQWHQLKQVGGLLLAVVPVEAIGPRLAAMPVAEMTEIICNLAAPAEEAERLKRRGFYVDMDRASRTREPSEITGTELASQLARAPKAVASASVLLNADAQTWILNPPREARELAAAMAQALTETGYARTPAAAAEVLLKAVSRVRDRIEARDAASTADPSRLQRPRRPAH
jgi:AbiV family abortive infection protein